MVDIQEFRKYAVGHRGISGSQIDAYTRHIENMALSNPNPFETSKKDLNTALKNPYIENMTRAVIEERPTHFREIDVFSRLIMDRVIFLGTKVNDEIANIIIAQLLFLESVDAEKDVVLYINSPGGGVYAGLGIYDTMQYIKPPVATTCTGLAASMAAVLLAGGAKGKRVALPHARIMIHQPLGGAEGQAADMAIIINQMLEVKKDLYHILSRHTGKSYEAIEKDADRDYWMRSADAKAYGIIDEVLEKK